jgi:hypothetical protein
MGNQLEKIVKSFKNLKRNEKIIEMFNKWIFLNKET